MDMIGDVGHVVKCVLVTVKTYFTYTLHLYHDEGL